MDTTPTATVWCGDAVQHLQGVADLQGVAALYPAIFTSLPDAAEVGMGTAQWEAWFTHAATVAIVATEHDGYTLFYQTDRRVDGALVDKAHLVCTAASAAGARVVWHKIAIRGLGTDLRRPNYAHLLAVSRRGRAGKATPDVYHQGKKVYPNATDTETCTRGLDFLASKGITAVADPFCGQGSIPYHAVLRGMSVWAIDNDAAQVARTRDRLAGHATLHQP